MSLYRVKYTHRADRDLEKLPLEIARKVVSAIQNIKKDPYQSIKKMKADADAAIEAFGKMRR